MAKGKGKDDLIVKPGAESLEAYLPPTKGTFAKLPELIRLGIPNKQKEQEAAE